MIRYTTLSILLACFATTALADTIYVRGKVPITNVTVVLENARVVKYTKGTSSRRREVPAPEVTGIVYSVQPRQFRKGLEFFNAGDYVNAALMLEAAASEKTEMAWVKDYALVYLGRAYLSGGRARKAIEAFRGVQSMGAESRWCVDVAAWMARAQASTGDVNAAKATIEALKSVLKSEKINGLAEQRANLAWGEAQISAKKWDDAVKTLGAVATALQSATPAEVQKMTLLVLAEGLAIQAMIGAGDTARADRAIGKLEARGKAGIAVAQAAARNGRAELLLAKGENIEETAFLLAQAKIQNFAAVSQMPRTCYLLGLAHLRLPNAKARAKSYFEELRARYPEAAEAVLAREQLKQL